MPKKISVDRHTMPLLTELLGALCFLIVGGFVGLVVFMLFTISWKLGLLLVGMILLWTFPYWAVYLWNNFIATEEEYYD